MCKIYVYEVSILQTWIPYFIYSKDVLESFAKLRSELSKRSVSSMKRSDIKLLLIKLLEEKMSYFKILEGDEDNN